MSRSDDQRIADLLDAAVELAAIVSRGRVAFDSDPVLRRASERLLEIIGEAANGLGEHTTARYPDVPWRDITRLRIVLAHHYHRVDPSQVWAIVAEEVPVVAQALREL
ncbi:MAG: HepT-like ribonuclease domain-containing protein [Acidimicrobiia bacterium]